MTDPLSLPLSRRRALALTAATIAAASGARAAEPWPTRAIRAIVPFSAGSASDVISRTALEQISVQLGQPIVVENRLGASGTIGEAMVAKAEPDGYTILANSVAHAVTPATFPNLPYDPVNDFAAVAVFANLPNVLVIAPSRGVRTARELAEAARAKPGSITYASGGTGSATHLAAELFRISAGFEGVHVPFKGAPEALTEVMTGRIDFYFCPILPALPLVRDGRLLALAVSSSRRASALPDVPTTVEAGFPNSDYNFWSGIFVPARTPKEIIERLNAESKKAVESAEVRAKFAQLGAEPMDMRVDEFEAYVRKEMAANAALVKAAGLGPK